MSDLKWKGFKEVIVADKVKESSGVYSFYLKNINGEDLPEFLPGQFISIRLKDSNGKYNSRAYTLSRNYNKDFYRISIKRESKGLISKQMADYINIGDKIEITIPVGNFYLKQNNKDVVLIGGGIGITPMITMAYECKNLVNKKAKLIYSTQNLENHSFREEIEELDKDPNINSQIFYTRVCEEGKGYLCGRITEEWMRENLNKEDEYYFCGPIEFMKSIYKNLINIGVSPDNINYELFKGGEDITK